MITDLLQDGVTYNQEQYYEMKKSIKNEKDRNKLEIKHNAQLLMYERMGTGEILAQTFRDTQPQPTIKNTPTNSK